MYGISERDYARSFDEDLRELRSPGKSGSFFFATQDMRFIVKSLGEDESAFLRQSLLEPYYNHIVVYPDSLLVRLCGLHTVTWTSVQAERSPALVTRTILVMTNAFPSDRPVTERYDLKGSTHGRKTGREASEAERTKRDCVLKDNDFRKGRGKLSLCLKDRSALLTALENDTLFLERNNSIDYSLLVGVAAYTREGADGISFSPRSSRASGELSSLQGLLEGRRGARQSIFTRDCGGYASTDESGKRLGEVFYISIIDFLQVQPYNSRKWIEHTIKSTVVDPYAISATDSKTYAARFMAFMSQSLGI
eukprot:m51a1_g12849 hypothetical protein (308) ;mRNA; f:143-1805